MFKCLQLTTKTAVDGLILLSFLLVLVVTSSLPITAIPASAQVISPLAIKRPTLRVGSQGEYVSELQAALKLLGFYSGAVSGMYNQETATAVSQFKRAVNLTADGVMDSSAWLRLFPQEPIVVPTVLPTNSQSPTGKP